MPASVAGGHGFYLGFLECIYHPPPCQPSRSHTSSWGWFGGYGHLWAIAHVIVCQGHLHRVRISNETVAGRRFFGGGGTLDVTPAEPYRRRQGDGDGDSPWS